RCGSRDGARRRRGSDEYRDCRRPGPGGDGRRDEAGSTRGAARLHGRPHPTPHVREREQPRRRPGRPLTLMPGPDDLAALKAEREAADREYNEALTRLDRAIQQLPADFPHPPPVPDEHQITPLNTLWKIVAPRARGG